MEVIQDLDCFLVFDLICDLLVKVLIKELVVIFVFFDLLILFINIIYFG